ncbi:TetR/AcrR family transcriptional regulator [Hydrogenophaga sp. XSHU_21]
MDVLTEDPPTPVRRSRGRPRKTALERDDGNRRQALLRAAARLFRQQGFSATSTRDIAAAVGMRSGSPFYHFDHKEALLAAVMEDGMQRALAHQGASMERAVAASPVPLSARDCLRVLVRSHFDNLLGPDSDHIPVMLYEWRVLSDDQKLAVNRLKDEYEAVWVPVLAALHAQGALRGDPRVARLMLFGALNWAAQWYVPGGRSTLDDLTDTAMQLFLKDTP